MTEASRETAESILGRWSLDISSLEKFVPPLLGNETLLLVGSVALGLATATSDIDLLWITDRPSIHEGLGVRQADFESSVTRHSHGYRVNVETWNTAQLRELATRVSAAVAFLERPSMIHDLYVLRADEVSLLHRLRSGIVLGGSQIADEWRSLLRTGELAAYESAVACWRCNAYLVDVVGELAEGHCDSAYWVLQLALDEYYALRLASVEETEPSSKWRIRLLTRHLGSVPGPPDISIGGPGHNNRDVTTDELVRRYLRWLREELFRLLEGKEELRLLIEELTADSLDVGRPR